MLSGYSSTDLFIRIPSNSGKAVNAVKKEIPEAKIVVSTKSNKEALKKLAIPKVS